MQNFARIVILYQVQRFRKHHVTASCYLHVLRIFLLKTQLVHPPINHSTNPSIHWHPTGKDMFWTFLDPLDPSPNPLRIPHLPPGIRLVPNNKKTGGVEHCKGIQQLILLPLFFGFQSKPRELGLFVWIPRSIQLVVEPPLWKNMNVKIGFIFPNFRGEHTQHIWVATTWEIAWFTRHWFRIVLHPNGLWKDPAKTSATCVLCAYVTSICIYIYIHTWNPFMTLVLVGWKVGFVLRGENLQKKNKSFGFMWHIFFLHLLTCRISPISKC